MERMALTMVATFHLNYLNSVFAGKDGSRATALNRMTPNFFNKPIDDLTVARKHIFSHLEMEGLVKIVEETYKRKYPEFGRLVYNSYRPSGHDEL